jgi:hypothetical protein
MHYTVVSFKVVHMVRLVWFGKSPYLSDTNLFLNVLYSGK